MKVSISVPAEDVEFLDAYAREHDAESRSAVMHKAIRLLRTSELADDYAAAWDEWEDDGEAAAWDGTVADGLGR